ncbi:hypothetical protein GUITHDRAFT_106255 [Guillardia theta CCMP2712]|uniref:Uncharacterized protein n=1 Tax=Guillardia theta (strain CCMP2712) TaxID=905079 RepID=L1JJB3_GUITC|nr:hypothetical protein GUITHDRAFT_106255 [Guillardia theta CCMP2712]EKX48180.1 hypothetical protein GUITHDRAFT_106255 [Guillardia theta CCMP2712]|eukprot:XP_005835160.1 hypothetical protein GUITHDRAFT_106255 [Guillardia theta CCMP2712]
MPARSSLFLLLIFFSSLSDVRSGGLNHFRRNGQVPRKSFAHSSIVSSLTRSKIRAARQAQEDKGWDDGIYNERKSVVDDEVIDGNRKPPLPPELTELPIPTRPDWRAITSKAMLDRAEHDEFMKWRKHLAALEDVYDVILTPFEKNPNYWRQVRRGRDDLDGEGTGRRGVVDMWVGGGGTGREGKTGGELGDRWW